MPCLEQPQLLHMADLHPQILLLLILRIYQIKESIIAESGAVEEFQTSTDGERSEGSRS